MTEPGSLKRWGVPKTMALPHSHPNNPPTPAGPVVEVSNLKCSGVQPPYACYSYEFEGEIHTSPYMGYVQDGIG